MMYKIALIFVACLSAQCVSASPNPASRDDSIDLPLDIAHFRDDFEGTELMESRIDSLSDLTGLISIIKEQFQSIIESCIAKIVEHILSVLKIAKHNLIEVLSKFTLGDIISKVLDCLSNVLVLTTPEVAVVEADEVVVAPAPVPVVRPTYEYGYPYMFRNYRSVKNETADQ